MRGLEDESRPSRCRQTLIATAVLAVVGVVIVGAHCCSHPAPSWPAEAIGEEGKQGSLESASGLGSQAESQPSLLSTGEADVGLDGHLEVIVSEPEPQHLVQLPFEEDIEASSSATSDQRDGSDSSVQLQRRQDDGANATSPSPSDVDTASTSVPVEPPTTTTAPPPDVTTDPTTLITTTVPPDTPTTTTSPPEETTTTEPPPPETTTSTTEDPPTTTVPPTSDPPTTTLGTSISSEDTSSQGSPTPLPPTSSTPTSTSSRSLADSSLTFSTTVILPTTSLGPDPSSIVTTEAATSSTLVTSVTSEEEEPPTSTTREEAETTAEDTTTEAVETTSSAVENVFTTTLPNGSKTVITSTTYVDVIASGEPTADATDPDLQNVAAGLSAGPIMSLIVAFFATCYFMA